MSAMVGAAASRWGRIDVPAVLDLSLTSVIAPRLGDIGLRRLLR